MFRIEFRREGVPAGGFDHPGPQHVAEHTAHLALKHRDADFVRVVEPGGGEVWSERKDAADAAVDDAEDGATPSA